MIKPHKLTKGNTIGIISPASGIAKDEIEHMSAMLKNKGYKIKIGQHAYEQKSYLAGSDDHRAADINNFFMDDTIDAIFCSRGGYGATRILEKLNYAAIKNNPKIFIGFSDITSIHLAIQKKCGLITFHGPMSRQLCSSSADYNIEYLTKALCSTEPVGQIMAANDMPPLQPLSSGTASGKIIGGNLSLITALLATPYEIETKNTILFLEDVSESPYRIDRMLTQLLSSGKLREVRGIILGEWSNCRAKKAGDFTVEDIIADRLLPLNIPILAGLPIGHGRYNITIPEGTKVYMDADKKIFYIQESALS
ncbi:S66 peptidase family protein [Pectinatus frisingensis]|uniref:S66 peptidase family protein n=1 Tax=Pectinatus frisingensis TaxID=865 RepID=UPI0018C81364|nr:LD-carboxypeptidase [Pectinatus frisingensis]